MKLPEKEKAAQKAAFRAMSPADKLDHIWTYFKWPILLGLIALLVLGSVLRRALTEKEPTLYIALANVSIGSELESELTEDFLRAEEADLKRQEIYLYRDLYLSENADVVNHEYAYASRMKVMSAIQTQKLDVAVMNREAYDLFSAQGYLLDLDVLLSETDRALRDMVSPWLTSNLVVLEDNTLEYQLGEAESRELITETVVNGMELTELPLFGKAGFPDSVYLGVIANSERIPACLQYIKYLLSGR